MLKTLSKKAVDHARPGDGDQFIWDEKTKGFGLKITPAGQRIFIFQYRWPGKKAPDRVTLARYGELTLDQARAEADKYRGDLRRGIRPSERKQRIAEESRAGLTVATLCDRYLVEGCA